MKKLVESYDDARWSFSIGAFFALNIILQIVLYIFLGTRPEPYIVTMHIAWLFWLIFIFRSRKIFPSVIVGARVPGRQKWLWLLALIPFLFLVAGIISIIALYVAKNHSEFALKILNNGEHKPNNHFFLILTSLVMAPPIEEFLFRGLILNNLMQKTSNSKAIIYSSLFFGFMHAQSLGVLQFSLGIILALAYISTSCLLVPITMHFIWNTLPIIFLTISHHPATSAINANDLEQLTIKLSTWLPVIMTAVVSGLLTLVWILKRYWPDRDMPAPYQLNLTFKNF